MKKLNINLSATSNFRFKDCYLTTGDIVILHATTIPFEFQAAITHVDAHGNLEVFSTQIAALQHPGIFSPDEITFIKKCCSGKEAIEKEARNSLLRHGGKVSVVIKGKQEQGNVIAAFDGIVVAWSTEKGFLTGGSSFFNPVA